MPPRLRDDGVPTGQRKKRKVESSPERKKKKKKNLPLPTPLFQCLCPDCDANPQCHPSTGLPGNGCWLTKTEWNKHANEQRIRGVANSLLGSLAVPPLQLPIPGEFGILPSRSPSQEPDPPAHPSPPPSPPIPEHDRSASEAEVLLNLIRPALDVIQEDSIVFRVTPDISKVNPNLLNDAELTYLCALNQASPSNSSVIGYQETMHNAREWVDKHPIKDIRDTLTRLRVKLLKKRLSTEEKHLKALMLEEWTRQAKLAQLSFSFDSSRYFSNTFKLIPPLALMAYLLVATLYLLCGVSIDHCSWTLDVLKVIVTTALEKSTDIFAQHAKDSFRRDVRGVVDILDLGPRFQAYVVCPSCCYLHTFDPDKPDSCPELCTNQDGGEICGAKLKRVRKRANKQSYHKPIRQYHHRSMKDYAAHLFSRTDLQQYLYDDPTFRTRPNPEAWDVWDAPNIRDFRGPDGSLPFVQLSNKEGRLIFSLNMDGFNPYGNKEAGKKVTIGGIYMICLNLPPSIRYNIENVYLVGVIPGPKEPTLHQINYFLKPLVDDLLQFWHTGVLLSRTTKYPRGWLVRCAVVPLVCDLPAARQMAGFASYSSHNFCSVCTLDIEHIHHLDPSKWTTRDEHVHRAAAQSWLHAQSQTERDHITNATGVRWSELLRLPYWNPIRYTIIDSMHAFYLRLFHHHCRSIWGMNVDVSDGPALATTKGAQPSEDEMRVARDTLRYGTKTSLASTSVHVLRQICKETGTLSHHGTKGAIIDRLVQYRIDQGWFLPSGRRAGDRPIEQLRSQPQTVLVDPEVQSFIKEGVIPRDLVLKSVDVVDDYFRNADKPAMNRLTRPDLQTLFLHKVRPGLEMNAREIKALTNANLLDLIQQKRQTDGFIDVDGWPFSKPRPVKKTVVLGGRVLAEVRKDMKAMNFPSWMARAPSHPGQESMGKFSADQWRTFCIYVLPVTLIRLWGDKDEGSIERRQLDNFMHLVTAVKIASMRMMTEERIVDYERHILAYLTTLQDLYPDVKITPYQHLSLHFGSFLRGFGPTHAWRCFPFERFNYVIQNMPTNAIFGEMEITLFHKFACAQRLRSFFVVDSLPSIIKPLVQAFHRTFRNDGRGTHLNDILAHQGIVDPAKDGRPKSQPSTPLTPTARRLLIDWIRDNDEFMDGMHIQPKAASHVHIENYGNKFTTSESSLSDSLIMVGDLSSSWRAGSIQYLFSHTRTRSDSSVVTQTFAVVSMYRSRSPDTLPGPLSAYNRYSLTGGKICENEFEERPVLVESSTIKAHVASCLIRHEGGEFLLALPLDKH